MYTTLISTEALTAHHDASWAIVDCRYDLKNPGWGHAQYLNAHVPGAVYASLSHDMSAPPAPGRGRHPLPPPEVMRATFSRLGIDAGTQVVLYDQDAGAYASRLWWMLRYMGHGQAAVLDGGWARWIAEGRPTMAGEEIRAASTFGGAPRAETVLGIDEVVPLVADSDTLLVDARAAERFEGRSETLDPAAGHIPGAVNHHYASNTHPDGTMLPQEQLRTQFEQLLDGRRPEQVVMYCGSGVTACHNLLAMEHAGLAGARLYPGSWSEWSSDARREIETGPARRRR